MLVTDREFLYIVSSALLLIMALTVSFRKPEKNDRSRPYLVGYFWSFFYTISVSLFAFTRLEYFPHIARTGVIPSLLMMPLSYFYVLQNISPRKLNYKDLLHLILLLLYLVDYIPFFMLNGDQKLAIYQGLSDADRRIGFNEGWFMPKYGHVIIRNTQIVGYVIAQYLLIKRLAKHPEHPIQFDNPALVNWMKLLVGSQVFFLLFPMFAFIIWGKEVSANFSNLGPLLVALAQTYYLIYEPRVLYSTSLYFSRDPIVPSKGNEDEFPAVEQDVPLPQLSSDQLDEVGLLLDQHMKLTKAYTRPGYKLLDLSDDTGIPVYKISSYVNKRMDVNFFTYLNNFRIREFLEKIALKEHESKTLEALAEECGFQSRGTFIRAFKHHTGTTPSDYIASRVAK